MPDGYMLDVWVVVSDLLDCMLQSMRKSLLVGFKIGPASIELVSASIVLRLVRALYDLHSLPKTYKGLPIVVDDQVRY